MDSTSYEIRGDESELRSNVYGFLSTVFAQEISKDFLDMMLNPEMKEVLTNMGIEWHVSDDKKETDQLLEELAVEYARLFLGPGHHLSPHESVYHFKEDNDAGQLWGDSALAVQKAIALEGLTINSESKKIPDHISIELEFMQQLANSEHAAWLKGDQQSALHFKDIQQTFINKHLACWVPEFCDRIMKDSSINFYKKIALLTKSFISIEQTIMEQT